MLENATTPMLACVELLGELETRVTVSVTLEGSTATSEDYSNSNLTLHFNTLSSDSQCFEIVINDDDIIEIDEEVISIVLSTTNDAVVIANGSVQVVVRDTSQLLLGFENSSAVIPEGQAFAACVRIFAGALAPDIEIVLNVEPTSGQGQCQLKHAVIM